MSATSLHVTGALVNPAAGLMNPFSKPFFTSSCTAGGKSNSSFQTSWSSCGSLGSLIDDGVLFISFNCCFIM
eukprot:12909880-Prorocentrum_lima.AAC.1